MQLWFCIFHLVASVGRFLNKCHTIKPSWHLAREGSIPLIFESALSFPWPTSIKSNEALACVKPNVNSRKPSGLSSTPARFIALARPETFAKILAITSTSSGILGHCSRAAFRRALAAFLPPSRPCRIYFSWNCEGARSVWDHG